MTINKLYSSACCFIMVNKMLLHSFFFNDAIAFQGVYDWSCYENPEWTRLKVFDTRKPVPNLVCHGAFLETCAIHTRPSILGSGCVGVRLASWPWNHVHVDIYCIIWSYLPLNICVMCYVFIERVDWGIDRKAVVEQFFWDRQYVLGDLYDM